MSDSQKRLESYIREALKKAGKSNDEIDSVVNIMLSLKFIRTPEQVDAFIKAASE